MSVVAIIPARAGSKTIFDKNIISLNGHPLIAYSIAAAKLSALIDRIIVSTDSEKYAEIAKRYGAEVPFIRPTEFATDNSTDRDFLLHAIKWLEINENKSPEYWVHLRPTTPLRDPKIVDTAIQLFMNDTQSTSLRSGHKAPESPLKWFIRDQDGYFKSLLSDGSGIESHNLPKEEFDDIFIPNGYVDILKKSIMDNENEVHGKKIFGFESPICSEIDSPEEFQYIQYQLDKSSSPLLIFLNSLSIDLK